MTEVHRVIDLAGLIARMTGAEIDLVENPRKEASHNELLVANDNLLGARPRPDHASQDDLLSEVDGDRAALHAPLRPRAHPLHVAVGAARGRGALAAARRPRLALARSPPASSGLPVVPAVEDLATRRSSCHGGATRAPVSC